MCACLRACVVHPRCHLPSPLDGLRAQHLLDFGQQCETGLQLCVELVVTILTHTLAAGLPGQADPHMHINFVQVRAGVGRLVGAAALRDAPKEI